MATPTDPTPNNPFVRWRTERVRREIPLTIDGQTEMVTDEYDIRVPVPPRDWDHIILNAVLTLAAILAAVSVAWTTASIGDLLATSVTAPIAYGAAIAFDSVWIGCMALEWLARHDRARALPAQIGGLIALAVAMTAVGVHGHQTGSLAVALVGGAVSALAKGMWTAVLRQIAPPLDEQTRQWIVRRDARYGAQLAVAARRRQHARVEGQHAALLAALGTPAPESADPGSPDSSGEPRHSAGTIRAAVRAAVDTLPNPTPDAVVAELDRIGLTVAPDDVLAILGRPPGGSAAPESVVRPIRGAGPTVLDSVRTAVASGVTTLPEVLRTVRATHGAGVREETVARYLRTALSERRPA